LTKSLKSHHISRVADLSKRERAVLSAIVTEFTATGEPVGSRTLSRKYGFDLSPATIRNVMADLEERGFLAQPHASAGRVPTEAAFRLFIEALMRVRQLSDGDTAKITSWFGEQPPGADLLRGAGRLLSDMTGAAAVLLRGRSADITLLTIRFIRARPAELLAVLVFSDGTVENRFVVPDQEPTERELERVHNLLSEVVAGRTLQSVREHFADSASEHRDELAELHRVGEHLINATLGAASPRAEMIIEGQMRLIQHPEFADPERLRELVRALEEREHLVGLLDHVIDARRVQVVLGGEMRGMGYPVSLIAAPYEQDGRPSGAVGVIGPTAMDYPTVIPMVRATAEAMSAALSNKGR
jgi:heat-inducible transcriptional repressor